MMKPITATAFMSLVDDGMFKLDDPVEKYIPAFKMLRAPALADLSLGSFAVPMPSAK